MIILWRSTNWQIDLHIRRQFATYLLNLRVSSKNVFDKFTFKSNLDWKCFFAMVHGLQDGWQDPNFLKSVYIPSIIYKGKENGALVYFALKLHFLGNSLFALTPICKRLRSLFMLQICHCYDGKRYICQKIKKRRNKKWRSWLFIWAIS